MYILKIKKAELVKAQYGNDIKVTMVGLWLLDGESHKFIKWVKLNERTLELLLAGQTFLNNSEAAEFGVL
jgi:hypothetical protein